jgi:hypothetical protein
MEYNELITRAQRASVEPPATDAILGGMRRTLHRRRQRRQAWVTTVVVLLAGAAMALPLLPSQHEPLPTLAERVSSQLDARPNNLPAPLAGYRHSMYKRQIYTLL